MTDYGVIFTASVEERDMAHEWRKRHVCKSPEDDRVLAWRFAPSGIATVVVVRCSSCAAEMDVTDYGRW